jgi:hypothetical protein
MTIADLLPPDTPQHMAPAWASCMSWAMGRPEIRAAFERDSGMRWIAPANAIERAIDDATGHAEGYVRAFIAWANINVWGPIDDAPVADEEGNDHD